MEYRKDKRAKNLTLRDIHVGDWVQVWSEQAERYSPPLKIIQICDDGTIYLVTSDEERCMPWEEDIKDVDALPIDEDLLRGFGFDTFSNRNEWGMYYNIYYKNKYVGRVEHNFFDDRTYINVHSVHYHYMHEYIEYNYRSNIDIKLEWKGIEK